ncbi:MAG: glycoside hydrolase, partial [Thermomicrobium sp.]|nr:glycoside hydrolase [Thermomicrobium sp.]
GVESDGTPDRYAQVRALLNEPFSRADLAETVRALDRIFGGAQYSLRSLFKDEQRKLLDLILTSTLDEAEQLYRHLYEDSQPLMRFLADLNVPIPRAFLIAAEVTVNAELRHTLAEPRPSIERLEQLFSEAETWHLTLDQTGLAYAVQESMEALALEWRDTPDDLNLMATLAGIARVARHLSEPVNTWRVQNIAYELLQRVLPDKRWRAQHGDPAAKAWVETFRSLCDELGIAVDAVVASVTAS